MASTFKAPDGKVVGSVIVLKNYFKSNEQSLADFTKEIKALTESERDELACAAASALGYNVVE